MSAFQAQILGNRFAALVREGAESFVSMARSPLVIEEGQYACALLDGEGRLIAQDQGEPSQLAAVQATVAHMLDAFAYNIAQGDVFLAGDPYCGGTWGGVLTLAVPVFSDGDLRFVAALRFATPDLAGNTPGVFQPDAHEIWQEALRLTPVKLLREGAPQKDVRQYLIRNSRAGALLDSDLTAATAVASHLGARLEAMVAQKGLALVSEAATRRIAYGGARMRAALAGLQPGMGEAGGIRVRLAPGESHAEVDFSGTEGASEGADNLSLAATRAAVLAQLAAPVIADAGMSQGVLDAVAVVAPEGSRVNPAFPAAVSLGWRVSAPLVAEALAVAMGSEPVIWPAAPLVMLFDEVGTAARMAPLTLSPGFTRRPGFAGADLSAGRRRLMSAEEAEMAGIVSLQHRQTVENEGVVAELRLTRGGLEGIVVPGSVSAPQLEGAASRARSNVLSLPEGTVLRFEYPAAKGNQDAKL